MVTPFDAAGDIIDMPTATVLVLYDERSEVYADDVRHRLGSAYPGIDIATVYDLLRDLESAGLVTRRKSPVSLNALWRLADGVVERATVAGLSALVARSGKA